MHWVSVDMFWLLLHRRGICKVVYKQYTLCLHILKNNKKFITMKKKKVIWMRFKCILRRQMSSSHTSQSKVKKYFSKSVNFFWMRDGDVGYNTKQLFKIFIQNFQLMAVCINYKNLKFSQRNYWRENFWSSG